jgi:type VI secretion system protein ImpB
MAESTQHKLDRIRPPRVQITYDVEIGDAIQMKELPFVGGIMADLSGKPEVPLPKLKDRKFIEIDRDNFNDIMDSINPRLVFQVPNKLADDDSKLNLELKFNHMDDFNPVAVLKQIKPLKKLYDARQRLSDLLTKLDGNDELDELLQDVIQNTENMEELKTLTASEEGGDEGAGDEGGDDAGESTDE